MPWTALRNTSKELSGPSIGGHPLGSRPPSSSSQNITPAIGPSSFCIAHPPSPYFFFSFSLSLSLSFSPSLSQLQHSHWHSGVLQCLLPEQLRRYPISLCSLQNSLQELPLPTVSLPLLHCLYLVFSPLCATEILLPRSLMTSMLPNAGLFSVLILLNPLAAFNTVDCFLKHSIIWLLGPSTILVFPLLHWIFLLILCGFPCPHL